jgi:hypothetical protein
MLWRSRSRLSGPCIGVMGTRRWKPAEQLEPEADDALRALGVVRVPLPEFAG